MLSKNLKKLRIQYDISAQRIAKFMQVSEQDILDWEAGTRRPSLQQCHELADLYDISYEELIADDTVQESNTKDTSLKKQKQQKGKQKKKTRKKQKTKKVNQKTVEKKQNWPLMIGLVMIGLVVAIGGFLYWKYGDEYSLIKKNTYTADELVGTFYDESAVDGITPVLTLRSDGTFTLTTSDCTIEQTDTGKWSVKKAKITLTSQQKDVYTLNIASANKITFTSSSIACAPKKQDVFIRGSAIATDKESDEKQIDTDTSETQSYIQLGSYSGSNSTMQITQITSTTARFTLQSYDPQDASHVATLSNLTGSIDGSTLTFEFQDDGYGNGGTGTMVFDQSKAVFHITITSANEDSAWAILTSGTLMK